MKRHAMVIALAVVVTVPMACAKPKAPPRVEEPRTTLLEPPQVQDPRYPRGYRIHKEAPPNEWTTVATFATFQECDRALHARIDETIDQAKASGVDAKHDLTVRRAVNARCIQPK